MSEKVMSKRTKVLSREPSTPWWRKKRTLSQGQPSSIALLLGPYFLLFTFFIVIPVGVAILLSFTYFNSIEAPQFSGIQNYIYLFTKDDVFVRYVLPNTLMFALVVGPLGYILQFLLAWELAHIQHIPRTILALIFYSPSMTGATTMAVIWKVLFSGDQYGYLNSWLMRNGWIQAPVQWITDPKYLMGIMLFVSVWSSMGVGFLSMLSGILNVDQQLYEAGYIDGVSSRFQEIVYITIPAMKPQMLFGAVMSIVSAFSAGAIGVQLAGANPTPQYAGQTMISHIEDHGFIQYNMGYASALSVILMLLMFMSSQIAEYFFGTDD